MTISLNAQSCLPYDEPSFLQLILISYLSPPNSFLQWIGIGDAEALTIVPVPVFKAVGSKSSYGPQGHRGMSILIFEASAVGFMEAELLSKRLECSGRGRESWCRPDRMLIDPDDGRRKVYGYMTKKSDIDIFNKYFIGLVTSHPHFEL